MEHHAPHPNAAFEGYYNKFFDLPSGATLVVVLSKINDSVKSRPNCVSFTYVPRDLDDSKIYQKEIFPEEMNLRVLGSNSAFIIEIPAIGFVQWNSDSSAEYSLEHESFSLHAKTTSHTPWSSTTNTPEGLLVNLPLPLHWHVQSLASDCSFSIKIPDYDLPQADTSGKAIVHQEKNYARSFPSAHMWVQAREGERGICCAGGQILGMEAFLLGYRSKDLNLDFRPPFAVRVLGYSPFLTYSTNWEDRNFSLSIQTFRYKITVEAKAPKGTFFSLSPPFVEGHRENYLGQSFQANVKVKVFERGWLTSWQLIREDEFERGSLEFGAGFYPPAGTANRIN